VLREHVGVNHIDVNGIGMNGVGRYVEMHMGAEEKIAPSWCTRLWAEGNLHVHRCGNLWPRREDQGGRRSTGKRLLLRLQDRQPVHAAPRPSTRTRGSKTPTRTGESSVHGTVSGVLKSTASGALKSATRLRGRVCLVVD
jgi:hypothetical protein